MATTVEYTLMAGASYISTRADINKFPLPQGWTSVIDPPHFKDDATGFEAVTFTNGTDIVISYAGTHVPDLAGDWAANLALAGGFLSDQLSQAADYYLAVKSAAPAGAKISFTGHSLGGGLASLMAVMFDEIAVTFDQAPFRMSANNDTRTASAAPAAADAVAAFIAQIDALLRKEHHHDYCGIVYADDLEAPTFVNIFDPNNLGVSCGFSDNPPLPGWILSRMPPEDIKPAGPLPEGRKR